MGDHEEFFANVRMWPEQFNWLLQQVGPSLQKHSIREPLSPRHRLGLALKYLAQGGTVKSIHDEFRVGLSTCHSIIKEVCDVIWNVLSPIFLPQPDVETLKRFAKEFLEQWQMPNFIGAIDGRHMKIKAPPMTGSEYYNYKGFFSIVLLAVCDANYKFTFVDVGQYGSLSDGGVWTNSELGQALDHGEFELPPPTPLPENAVPFPYYFVADEAFPLNTFVMRPYPKKNQERLTPEQRVFNYRLSRARRIVENAFGILVWRWQILNAALTCSVEKAESIVKALVFLHNMLMENRNGMRPGLVDVELNNGDIQPGAWRADVADVYFQQLGRAGANRAAATVVGLREHLAQYLASDVGAAQTPWQFERVFRGAHLNVP